MRNPSSFGIAHRRNDEQNRKGRRDRPPCLSCLSWLSFVRTGTEACPYRNIGPAPREPPCRRPRNQDFLTTPPSTAGASPFHTPLSRGGRGGVFPGGPAFFNSPLGGPVEKVSLRGKICLCVGVAYMRPGFFAFQRRAAYMRPLHSLRQAGISLRSSQCFSTTPLGGVDEVRAKPASDSVGGIIRTGDKTHFTPHRFSLRTNRSASSSGFPLGKPDPQGGGKTPSLPVRSRFSPARLRHHLGISRTRADGKCARLRVRASGKTQPVTPFRSGSVSLKKNYPRPLRYANLLFRAPGCM